MPASVAIPAAIGAVSTGASIFQTMNANQRTKEAKKQMEEYQRQELQNPYENLQVSTMGADLQREELARNIATNAGYAAMGGSRAIMGLAPQMLQQQAQQNAQIAAGLDQQYNQNQQLAARGNEMVQTMTENREQQDLMGIGNAYNVARQEAAKGLSNAIQSGLGVAKAIAGIPQGDSTSSTVSSSVVSDTPLQSIPQSNAPVNLGQYNIPSVGIAQQPTYHAPNYAAQLFPIQSFGAPASFNPYAINPYKLY